MSKEGINGRTGTVKKYDLAKCRVGVEFAQPLGMRNVSCCVRKVVVVAAAATVAVAAAECGEGGYGVDCLAMLQCSHSIRFAIPQGEQSSH